MATKSTNQDTAIYIINCIRPPEKKVILESKPLFSFSCFVGQRPVLTSSRVDLTFAMRKWTKISYPIFGRRINEICLVLCAGTRNKYGCIPFSMLWSLLLNSSFRNLLYQPLVNRINLPSLQRRLPRATKTLPPFEASPAPLPN